MRAEQYMQHSFSLAQRAKGHTAPNPMVGAVLVHKDRIIGEGWHHYYGADHAEINCLKNVATDDKQFIPESTMYVNLEPCAHYGITPPCANRLVAEKVKSVVIANKDPFEQVSGKGIDILQDGGVEVVLGVMEKEGLWLNRRFLTFHTQKRPYIILKWAETSDGFIAPPGGSRLQISGDDSHDLSHKWRTEEAAILVGTRTALADNPQLTARRHEGRQPLRIVMDRNLQIPGDYHLYDNVAATWIVNEKKELLNGNVHLVQLHFDETLLAALMHKLYDAKILSLIVEGGSQTLNNFISAGLWDEARIFTASLSLKGGIAAPELSGEAFAFGRQVGNDKLQVYTNKKSAYSYVTGMEL